MNKKLAIIIGAVVLILILGFLVIHFKPAKQTQTQVNSGPVVKQMSGKIVKLDKSSFSVEGQVDSATKTIEFSITPQTVIKVSELTITADQLKSGGHFQPKTVTTIGKFSDLTLNLQISRIVSNENLLQTNKATAAEINLTKYDFSPPPTK